MTSVHILPLLILAALSDSVQIKNNSLTYKPRYQHPAYRVVPQRSSIPRSFQIATNRSLPCCRDESGGSVCRVLKNNDPRSFANKCASEPDFSLVVCCKSCNELGANHRERATNFFSANNNSTHCFDRMSTAFCARFQTGSDAWNAKRWSCNTEHYRLGFRVCRATCGFCSLDWQNAKETDKCNKA